MRRLAIALIVVAGLAGCTDAERSPRTTDCYLDVCAGNRLGSWRPAGLDPAIDVLSAGSMTEGPVANDDWVVYIDGVLRPVAREPGRWIPMAGIRMVAIDAETGEVLVRGASSSGRSILAINLSGDRVVFTDAEPVFAATPAPGATTTQDIAVPVGMSTFSSPLALTVSYVAYRTWVWNLDDDAVERVSFPLADQALAYAVDWPWAFFLETFDGRLFASKNATGERAALVNLVTAEARTDGLCVPDIEATPEQPRGCGGAYLWRGNLEFETHSIKEDGTTHSQVWIRNLTTGEQRLAFERATATWQWGTAGTGWLATGLDLVPYLLIGGNATPLSSPDPRPLRSTLLLDEEAVWITGDERDGSYDVLHLYDHQSGAHRRMNVPWLASPPAPVAGAIYLAVQLSSEAGGGQAVIRVPVSALQ